MWFLHSSSISCPLRFLRAVLPCHLMFFSFECLYCFCLFYFMTLLAPRNLNIINCRETAETWSRNRYFVKNSLHVLHLRDISAVWHQYSKASAQFWWSVFYNEPCCTHLGKDSIHTCMDSCSAINLSSSGEHVDVRCTESERSISVEEEKLYTESSLLSSSHILSPFPCYCTWQAKTLLPSTHSTQAII